MACIPMYSMMGSLTLYASMLYFSPSWVRTSLLVYFPFILLDPRPRIGQSAIPYSLIEYFRYFWPYRVVADYFSATLVKTCELSPKDAYIFLYHPHGVIGMGSNMTLTTNMRDFPKVFPGIRRYGITLNASFYVPLFREWLLALGYIGANKSSLRRKLREKSSIVLVPGGAAEALHAHESNFRCYIKSRLGFIKLALETGAKPVPCLGFGENAAFSTFYTGNSSSLFLSWQRKLCKLLSFSLPVITNPIPNRVPITVVVGKPVEFRSNDPQKCHDEYLEAVRKLYYENREKYGDVSVDIEFL